LDPNTAHSIVEDHPALQQLFSAYFTEEWKEEFGSVDGVLTEYARDNDSDAVAQAEVELRGLLDLDLSEEELGDVLLHGFGSSYVPSGLGASNSAFLQHAADTLRKNRT
jgi:hypothetical protein